MRKIDAGETVVTPLKPVACMAISTVCHVLTPETRMDIFTTYTFVRVLY